MKYARFVPFSSPNSKIKRIFKWNKFLMFSENNIPFRISYILEWSLIWPIVTNFCPLWENSYTYPKKPLCIFQPQAQNKKKLLYFFKKQNSYIFEWMLTKRKISYIPLYSGITADLAYLVKFLNQGETWKIPKQT